MDSAAPRHAVVSGASSGIGAAVCDRLLAEGWRVTGLSRRDPGRRQAGYTHLAIDLLAEEPRLEGLGDRRTDALVHAAGLMRAAPLGALDQAAGRLLWRLHVEAAERLAQALLPGMGDGGRIVLIGSRAAQGMPGRSQYGASKAALLAMARSWAQELAPRRITVNVVAPAATDTPMLRDPARAAAPARLPPIGRLIAPAEVAALVAFLLGEEAGAITGQQITICGGASL
jgi:NAD(P)-dependent dehydrogenase (short-subunit alcohol dehydrogenase family)